MKTQKHLAVLTAFFLAIPGIGFSDGPSCGGGSPPPGQPNPSQPLESCPGDSSDNPDDAPQDDGDDFDSTGDSDPVSMATGALQFSATDLKLPGVKPIVFARYFDSTMLYAGPLGNNWDFSFNRRLSFESGNTYYHTGQGYEVQLTYTPPGLYALPPGSPGVPERIDSSGVISNILAIASNRHDYALTHDATTNQFTVSDNHGNKDIFDSTGHLIKSLDRNGNELDYTRDSAGRLIEVEDPAHGTYMTFDLDTNGYITSITDSAGRTVSYAYDSNYNLTGVTYPPT
jgi:YD repeat-containing protein